MVLNFCLLQETFNTFSHRIVECFGVANEPGVIHNLRVW